MSLMTIFWRCGSTNAEKKFKSLAIFAQIRQCVAGSRTPSDFSKFSESTTYQCWVSWTRSWSSGHPKDMNDGTKLPPAFLWPPPTAHPTCSCLQNSATRNSYLPCCLMLCELGSNRIDVDKPKPKDDLDREGAANMKQSDSGKACK